MTVIFETYSIILTVLSLPHVARAKRVIFFRTYLPVEDASVPRGRQWVQRIIRMVNPWVPIVELDKEIAARAAQHTSYESDRYIEELFRSACRWPSYLMMRELISDEAIEYFYKIRMLPAVLRRAQFYRVVRDILSLRGDDVAIPKAADPTKLHRYVFDDHAYASCVPWLVRMYLNARRLAARAVGTVLGVNVLFLLGSPWRTLLRVRWRATQGSVNHKICADAITPLIWGMGGDGGGRGPLGGYDDTSILGGELTASRIAFYFSDWEFPSGEESVLKVHLKEKNLTYFDPRTFALEQEDLRDMVRLYWKLAREILRRPMVVLEETWFARMSAALWAQYLKERQFVRRVDYKVSLEYQDYSAAHIVRTIVANQNGRLTVGMHHGAAAAPYNFPSIRYTHINKLCVYGEVFSRQLGRHWQRLRMYPIGAYRIDLVREAQRRLGQLGDEYKRFYGGARPLVLVLFPSLSPYILRSRVREELEGLHLLKQVDGELTVICRFRTRELADAWRQEGLQAVVDADPRIQIDHAKFTTYEWMALADVVISSGHSTGVIEAAGADKKCFSFDHMLTGEIVYGRYGKDLVLKTREDVLRVIEGARNGFQGFDCRWADLANDFSYYSDGHSMDRYRRVILDAIDEVDAARNPVTEASVWSRVGEQHVVA